MKIIPESIKQEAVEETKKIAQRLSNVKILDEDFLKLLQKPIINYPEKTVGKYSIKLELIPPNTNLTVVSIRNWFMMGYKPLNVKFINEFLMVKLVKEGHGLLVSNSPQEMFLQYEAYKNARGKILVGGLGLGLFVNLIAKKSEVTEIVIIEKEADIIKLVRPYLTNEKMIRVLHDDIWKFIRGTKETFDYVYIDIHYSTGAMEYIHTVLPMRKLLAKKFPNIKVDFWGEEEMKAQYNPNCNCKECMKLKKN